MPQLRRSGRARGEPYNWTNLGSVSPCSIPEAKDAVSGGEERGEKQSWGARRPAQGFCGGRAAGEVEEVTVRRRPDQDKSLSRGGDQRQGTGPRGVGSRRIPFGLEGGFTGAAGPAGKTRREIAKTHCYCCLLSTYWMPTIVLRFPVREAQGRRHGSQSVG